MNTKVFYSFLLIALASFTMLAQQISFKSEAERNHVSIGEIFNIGFFIKSNTTSYSLDQPMKYPEHRGFQIVGEQHSQSITYINGKGVIEDGTILSFVADKEGSYQIGSAKIVINGKTYVTSPINILVKNEGIINSTNKKNEINQEPIFLESKISKINPYVNEQVSLSIRLYAKDLSYLNRIQNFKQGNLDDLNPKMVKNLGKNIKQEIVAGKQYFSQEIAHYYVFPKKLGKIKIEPFSVGLIVPSTFGIEPIKIYSNSIIINTKALPENGKPENFSGAVGEFNLNTFVDKKVIAQNESINYDVEIVGSGNFNSIKFPNIEIPNDLEKFSPKKRDAYNIYDTGMKGKIAEQIVLVPNSKGSYTLSPVEFSFFDPIKEQYIKLKSDPINLTVNKSKYSENISQDITNKLNEKSSQYSIILDRINNNKQFILLALGIFCLSLFIFKKKNKSVHSSQSKDQVVKTINETLDNKVYDNNEQEKQKLSNNDKPTININRINEELELLKLKIHTTDPADFYKIQEDVLTSIAMKKTNIDLASFCEDLVIEKFSQQNIDQDIINKWKLLFNNAQKAKYGFGDVNQDLEDIYNNTVKIVKEIIS